jgi:hypothetical protein
MPCYLTGSEQGDRELETKEEVYSTVTELTRLLCKACTNMDKYFCPMSVSLRKWWENHQMIDMKRS